MKCLELLFPKAESTKTSLHFIGITPCVSDWHLRATDSTSYSTSQKQLHTSLHLSDEWWGRSRIEYLRRVSMRFGLSFFGFLTRLALLPMIFTMIVAFTTVFGGSISAGELPFLYLIIFVLSWFAGAGKFSVDGIIRSKISRDNS